MTDFGYTGQRHDSETGLMYFKNRYYSTSMGSFVTMDPLGFVDGMSRSLGYFGANGVDPFGLIDDQPSPPGRGDFGYREFHAGIKLKGILIMATRPLDNTYGATFLNHLSLEFWGTSCNSPSASVEYSRNSLKKTGAVPLESVELLRKPGYKAWKWYSRKSTITNRWTKEWREANVAVSIIKTNELRGETLAILKVGDYANILKVWQSINQYAKNYEFAEYVGSDDTSPVTVFKNWPNSEYKIGADQINSNTFIYSVLNNFGLNKGNMVSGYNPGKYPAVKIAIDPYFGQKPTFGVLSPKPTGWATEPANYVSPEDSELNIYEGSDL